MNDTRKSLIGLIVSGFFIALPVLLVGLVLAKAFQAVESVLPLLDELPGVVFRSPAIRALAVLVAIVAVLLLVGLLARTRVGVMIGRWLERKVLVHLPLYSLLRNLASGMSGKDDGTSLRPVLVTVNPGIQQMGLIIERHSDGSATVFLPSSPNPGSGSVIVAEASLMRELHIPAQKVFKCYSGWGDGTAAVLSMARDGKSEKI